MVIITVILYSKISALDFDNFYRTVPAKGPRIIQKSVQVTRVSYCISVEFPRNCIVFPKCKVMQLPYQYCNTLCINVDAN